MCDLCVYICVSVTFVIIGRIFAKIKNVKNDDYKFLYFPSIGAITNVIFRDLDLLFQGQIFKMLISRKR